MSKSSTATARTNPVPGLASASGAFGVHAETLTVETNTRVELVDLTDRLAAVVARLPVREGLVSVVSMHTTSSIFISEAQAALVADIKTFLERIVDRDADWLHNDPQHSDCDRFNADAHLRAMVLGHSLTLQVSRREVVLGQWQRVMFAELDGPRARTVRVMVMGA